jgi:hypothetical protein
MSICGTARGQIDPAVVDCAGGYIVAWSEWRKADYDIYAARVTTDGLVSTLPALVSVQVESGLVRLRWYGGNPGSSAILFKRTSTSDWVQLAELAFDGSGQLIFEDRAGEGGRLAYRLEVAGVLTPEVWVDVVPLRMFGITCIQPNPALGISHVTFSLDGSAPGQLDVCDVSGRVVAIRDVGEMGPGSHSLEVPDQRRLSPGMYFVRLRQGPRISFAKVVIAR